MRFPVSRRRCWEVNKQNPNLGNLFDVNESAIVNSLLPVSAAAEEPANACAHVLQLSVAVTDAHHLLKQQDSRQ